MYHTHTRYDVKYGTDVATNHIYETFWLCTCIYSQLLFINAHVTIVLPSGLSLVEFHVRTAVAIVTFHTRVGACDFLCYNSQQVLETGLLFTH